MAPPLRRLSSSSSSSSSCSGNDTSAAIDAIIAEASDLIALEHVAALNTAHLSDTLLPSDLEARFRKLKSFPAATPKYAPRAPPEEDDADVDVPGRGLDRTRTAPIPPIDDVENSQDATKRREGCNQDLGFPEQELVKKLKPKPKYDLGSPTSSPFSFGSLKDSPSSLSPSPPKQRCCFGFSPKKVAAAVQRRKGKGDEVAPEVTVHALKQEQRKLKKALQQQEKLTREAARMVRRAKQTSARMTAAAVDELLSDLEEELK